MRGARRHGVSKAKVGVGPKPSSALEHKACRSTCPQSPPACAPHRDRDNEVSAGFCHPYQPERGAGETTEGKSNREVTLDNERCPGQSWNAPQTKRKVPGTWIPGCHDKRMLKLGGCAVASRECSRAKGIHCFTH